MMKGTYFTFLLITVLSASTPAFAQTLVIFKNAKSIEVDSAKYENNQCIYTKNGSQRSVPLDLIEEIYVVNKGRIYPPRHREPTESQDTEITSDIKESYERNNEKKKSEDNITIKDTVKPVEKTYLYKAPQGFFQCKIPKSWNYNEINGVHKFSPYSFDGAFFDKTVVQILKSPKKVHFSTLSEEWKFRIVEGLEIIGEEVLASRVRVIDGIEAWETFFEIQRPKPRKKHQIRLVHNGYLVNITLEAPTEFYESADRQFERVVESLKFL